MRAAALLPRGVASACLFLALAVATATEAQAETSAQHRVTISYAAPTGSTNGYEVASIDVDYKFIDCAGDIVIQYGVDVGSLAVGSTYRFEGTRRDITAAPPQVSIVELNGTVYFSGHPLKRLSERADAHAGAGCLGQTTTIAAIRDLLGTKPAPDEIQGLLDGLALSIRPTSKPLGSYELERQLRAEARAEKERLEKVRRDAEAEAKAKERERAEQAKQEADAAAKAEAKAAAEAEPARADETTPQTVSSGESERERLAEAQAQQVEQEKRDAEAQRRREAAEASAREAREAEERIRRDYWAKQGVKLRNLRMERAFDDSKAEGDAAAANIAFATQYIVGVNRVTRRQSYSMSVTVDEHGLAFLADGKRLHVYWRAIERLDVSDRGRVQITFATTRGEVAADLVDVSDHAWHVASALRDAAAAAGNHRIPEIQTVRDLDALDEERFQAAQQQSTATPQDPQLQSLADASLAAGELIGNLIDIGSIDRWSDLDVAIQLAGEGGPNAAVAWRVGKYFYFTGGMFYGKTKPHDFEARRGRDLQLTLTQVPFTRFGVAAGLGLSVPLGRFVRIRGEGAVSAGWGSISEAGELEALFGTVQSVNMFAASATAHLVFRIPDFPLGIGVFARYETSGLGDNADPIQEQGYIDTNGNQLDSLVLRRTTDQSAYPTYGLTFSLVM